MAINIVEHFQVSPSQGAAAEQLLPLLYFDMIWLPASHLTETLYFYNFQCSESHFLDTIVPNLKNSLSLTLKHFLPLSGNIVFPLSSTGVPVSHYVAGDYISLTIALSSADFIHLTGNHSRDADVFHGYVPQMLQATYSSDHIKFSVIAAQVTLFPNQGISIGFTHHHAICDGANLFGFVQTWASINKFNGDAHLVELGEKFLPFYDRSNVQDANKLATIGWNQMKTCRPTVSLTISLPTCKVRGTFVLSGVEIEKLKNFVMNKKPAMAHVSSFMVVCGHVWSCLAKSAAAAGEEVADDEPEYLTSPTDCRARLNPPLPDTYFGNCLIFFRAKSTHGKLKGNEGFVAAAEAIAEAINKAVNNDRGILDGFENRLQIDPELIGKRVVPVAASPRLDLYGADYGWGRPKKFECLHIDFDGSVSICKSREGGFEIGLSMPKVKIDAFAAIFKKNIYINSNL